MGNCGSENDCSVQGTTFPNKEDKTRTSLEDVLEAQARRRVFKKIRDIKNGEE